MAVYFFLHSVLYAIAIYYTAEKIIEKLQEEIRDDALQEIIKYVAAQTGDNLAVASIRRPLGYLLSIAGLYIAKQIGESVVEKIKGYAVEKIGEYVVAPVRDSVVAPIRRKLGYLRFYKSNIKDFRTQMENLENTREKVQGLVDAAERNGEVILPIVREWLTNVNKVIEESMNIFEDGLLLNLKLRYRRSRNAKEKTSDVDKLTREGNSFDIVSTYALAFKSRKFIFDEVMEAVKDDGIGMIGIYGMGGVGKTTLAKEVQQQANDGNLFDEVVMPVVSQSPDPRRIQGDIADKLRLKLDAEGIPGRAEQLSKRLKKIKKILIILDDVWKPVELDDIGIPFGERHKGCKIVLTSRSRDVCNQMGTKKTFSVAALSSEEGWKLFRDMAGESVGSKDLYPLAVEIAGECAGLPLAIVTLAKALKGKQLFHWRATANQLRKSNPDGIVKLSLELSYSHLEREEPKAFFLLCCLYPEDSNIAIEDLMKYGMGLGLFQNVDTVDEAREEALSLAYSLISSCLLQDVSNEECVKMHDVIRDVAISIASNGKHVFLVIAGPGWKEFPVKDTYKSYTAMSLVSDDIQELPGELECPELQTIYLQCPHPSLQFPDNFFMRMENLKVLDMSDMRFLSLPTSLRYLKNLRTLCLNRCILEDLSIIGELKKLEILSFIRSQIKQLPKEIGMLTCLRLLDLTRCEELTIIPPKVIRGLSRLEGLYMRVSFCKWEMERQDGERSNVSLAELKHLARLINLDIQIPNADLLPEDLLFKNLSRFKISIGTSFGEWDQFSYSKTLKLKLNVSTALKNGVKELLKKVEHFHLLGEMKGLKSVLYDLDRDGFRDLRYLIVEECSEVEHIFNASECSELQELRLRKLPRLMNLWKEPTRHVGFRNLTVVKVEACDGLKNLFSHSVAKQLSKVLVELDVEDCEIMEEIVGNGKEAASVEVDDIVFLHLRSLTLRDLPKLRNFFSKVKGDVDTHTQEPLFDKKVSFPQLRVLNMEGCHKVSKVVPFNLLPSLEEINVQECDSLEEVVEVEVEGLVVEEGHVNETLSQLKTLKLCLLPKLKHIMRCDKYPHRILGFKNLSSIDIFLCNSLKSLFSPSMANCLAQLKEVEIDSCEMMESIIAEEREGEENCKEIVFPKLCTLKLLNLPKLISFMKTFTSIISIQQKLMTDDEIVKEAPQEGNLCDPIQPLFNEKVAFPVLETLQIENIGNLIEIGLSQLPFKSFSQLKVLKVEGYHKVSKIVPFNFLKWLLSLEELSIENCDSMEEIIGVEGLVVEEGHVSKTLSQWKNLKLRGLPKLKHIMRWDMYPHGTLGFQNLSSIHIFECNSLASLFSPSMASNLVQLQKLEIDSCEMMESIIADERQGEDCIKIVEFPRLSTLQLKNLPKLISFMQTFTSNFSIQQKLMISDGVSKVATQEGNLGDPIKPLFDQKVAFPVLETLQIYYIGNLIEIQHSQLLAASFPQLKVLKVEYCHKVSKIVAFNLLKRLLSLEELSVEDCDLVEEIIGVEGLVVAEGHVSETLSQLRELKLQKLPKLKHIMRWDMYPHGTLGFRNLSSIHIYECNSLTSLLSPSTASNLVQLQKLEIDSCEMMESIIAVEGEGEDCIEIVEFPQLRTLRFKNLPKLISFRQTFTSNFSVRTTQEGNLGNPIQPLFDKKVSFPQLKVLNVEGCYKVSKVVPFNLLLNLEELNVKKCYLLEEVVEVEVEVEGLVVFPQLRLLKLENLPKLIGFMKTIQQKLMIKDEIVKEAPQEGNLPDPIQPLFDEKVTLPTIEVLKIKGLDKLEDIWHPQFQAKSFCQLKVLEVGSCHRISNVIPSNLLKHLTKLEEVSVENCDSVEIIFEVEWLSVEDRRGTMTLSQLRKLSLFGLPKLFTSKHPILQKLQMDDEESKGKPHESNSCITIRPLFDEWVAFTNLVELRIVNIENLQEIFHTRLADESFSQLRILEVTKCHKLSRVASSNLLPRLQNLEKLSVEGCNSMEKIFELEGEGRTPISLSQLEYMELCYLPSLLIFCSGKYDFELPSLEIFRFEECPKMQTFSNGLKSTPNLKRAYAVKEIKRCLYVIKDLVDGLHSREQESSVEDEEKDKDEEVGEKSKESNIEEHERKENISAQAVHHEKSEEAEQEGHRKGSMEAIREHLKVMTNLLDELGVEEEEDDEEEEGESEKAGEANIEELQEIREHLEEVIMQVEYFGGLYKRKRVGKIRRCLKRMMDLVDILGLREQELSIEKLKRDISSGNEVEEGEEGNASACQGIQHKISEIEVQAQL